MKIVIPLEIISGDLLPVLKVSLRVQVLTVSPVFQFGLHLIFSSRPRLMKYLEVCQNVEVSISAAVFIMRFVASDLHELELFRILRVDVKEPIFRLLIQDYPWATY